MQDTILTAYYDRLDDEQYRRDNGIDSIHGAYLERQREVYLYGSDSIEDAAATSFHGLMPLSCIVIARS